MKSYLPLLTFAILLASCSSVYKSGQTPDDVYFSPERPREEYVRTENREERRYVQTEEELREDRYLRMKTRNRRFGLLDNDVDVYAYNGPDYYRYNDYYRMNAIRYNQSWWMWNPRFGNFYSHDPFFFNPYYHNPYYASPYYSGVVYGNVNPRYNRPRTSNLNMFDANGNRYNPPSNKRSGGIFGNSGGSDNYRSSGSNAGGFLRGTFGGNNNNNNSSSGSSSNKTSVGGSGSSSSSSGSSSGASRAPVRKF